ncbi:MAG TPA: GNAT family N-acetyltransferase [Acidimicrobiales bacterium]|nr:GNAT family N-acetyltransferase [Acidimicrobiales bacterium]
MTITYSWRGEFENVEYKSLHADAFGSDDGERNADWRSLLLVHSLGWVIARKETELVGFVNVVWDGHAHAWIQDVMVASTGRNEGIGTELVSIARDGSTRSGCEWLHVDFEERLNRFYVDACGFVPSSAGLIHLK